MKTVNEQLSDSELRGLLNQLMLKEPENNVLTQNLIEMEAKVIFRNPPMYVPVAAAGMAILAKLNSKMLYKILIKWLLISGSVTGISTVVYQNINPEPEKVAVVAHQAAIKQPSKSETSSPLTVEITPAPTQTTAMAPAQIGGTIKLPFREAGLIGNQPSAFSPTPMNRALAAPGKEAQFEQVKTIRIYCDFANISVRGDQALGTGKVALDVNLFESENVESNPKFESTMEGSDLVIRISHDQKRKLKKNSTKIKNAELAITTFTDVNLELHNNAGDADVAALKGDYNKVYCNYGNVTLNDLAGKNEINVNSGNVKGEFIKGLSQISCNYGNITISHQQGDLKCSVNSGNTTLSDVESNLNIEDNYGNVTISNAKGEQNKIDINSGNLTMENSQMKLSSLSIAYGNIKLNNNTSQLKIKSNSGNIELRDHQGDTQIDNAYGNQEISHVTGNLVIATESGKLSLDDISGNVNIEGNFSNVLLHRQTGNLTARINSGNLKATGINLNDLANLHTEYGNISLQTVNSIDDLNLDLESSSGTVMVNKNGTNIKKKDGSVNIQKGKIHVTARANSGNIQIE